MDAAESIDLEFGLLCYTLLYTGRRIGDLLNDNTNLRNLNSKRATLYLGDTKNGEATTVHLPPIVIEKFKTMPPSKLACRSRRVSAVFICFAIPTQTGCCLW